MKRLLIVILAILVMAGAVFAQDAEPGAGETAKPAETKTEPVEKKKAKASLKISGEFRTYTGYKQMDSEDTGSIKAGQVLFRSEMRLKFKAKYSDWLVGFGYVRARQRFKNDESEQSDGFDIKDEVWTRIGRKTGIFAFIGTADIMSA